jgi:hypothetical protein
MWEVILWEYIVAAAFVCGWGVRGVADRKKSNVQQTSEPEMMWFNDEKSRWERVTELKLHVADRVVVKVPVKLVKQSEER